MDIQKNDTQYKEETIEELFDEGRSSESDAIIENLLEKNNTLNEEVISYKIEHEIQVVRLYEVAKEKKKDEEDKEKAKDDKEMTNEHKRQLVTRLDERIKEVHNLTHNQFDMLNQFLSANHDIARKELEITNLKSKNEK